MSDTIIVNLSMDRNCMNHGYVSVIIVVHITVTVMLDWYLHGIVGREGGVAKVAHYLNIAGCWDLRQKRLSEKTIIRTVKISHSINKSGE